MSERQTDTVTRAKRRLHRLRVRAWAARKRLKEDFVVARLWLRLRFGKSQPAPDGLIASLTSFPARIDHVWIPIMSLLCQDLRPQRVVLVLSDEEFPDRKVPRSPDRLGPHGLEILWVEHNHRSFDKLIPILEKYPDMTVVTFDDDLIYERSVLRRLVASASVHPGAVVGIRGWEIGLGPEGLLSYREWNAAGPSTHSKRTFLTSGGGVLFPPNSLSGPMVCDLDLAMKLCPKADDIWFWAASVLAGSERICVGGEFGTGLWRSAGSPSLSSDNFFGGENDPQLRRVLDHFGITVCE